MFFRKNKEKVNWYVSRLSSMSFGEIGFRIKQNIAYKKRFVKREESVLKSQKERLSNEPKRVFSYSKLNVFSEVKCFSIFAQEIDIYNEINWHKDISSNKEFPLIPSKKIDTRSSVNGDAKYTWEVNRLNFLLIFATNYNSTKLGKYLSIFQKQLNSWIDDNPYLIGVNWYSNIEINLRLILWFFCWEILDVNKIILENKEFAKFVEEKWLPTIYLHCKYSYENLSKYSSANNHLISEFSGLFIASNYWQFDESPKWKKYSILGLEREIIKQHTKNGINKEQAAEYIQFIADFFIIPLVITEKQNQNVFSKNYRDYCKKIIDYIFDFTDAKCNYPKYGDEDDGVVLKVDLPYFNNFKSLLLTGYNLFNETKYLSKIDIYDNKNLLLFPENKHELSKKTNNESSPKSHVLINPTFQRGDYEPKTDFAERTLVREGAFGSGHNNKFDSKFFLEEGHLVYKNEIFDKKEFYFYFKASNLGYLGTAAHGHADALSFILHFNGKPILVDPGTYTYYGNENYRKYFKGTLAHNTIRVDEKDQAHYSGSMLWSNHYNCKIMESKFDKNGFIINASHNGYERHGLSHERKINFIKSSMEIIIFDSIKINDNSKHLVELPFHFHPSVGYLKEVSTNSQILKNNEIKVSITNYNEMNFMNYYGSKIPICGWYSQNYGKIEPTNTIVYKKKIKENIVIKTVIKLEQI